jgi:hypothetical protein
MMFFHGSHFSETGKRRKIKRHGDPVAGTLR